MSSALQPQRRHRPSLDACVFCSFVRSEHATVYEDSQVYAFLDDYPLAQGHTLVVLKNHARDITELTEHDAADLGRTVAHVSKALKDALGASSIYLASVGEQVQHVHYHLIPRYEADEKGFVHFLSRRGRLTDGEALAARIRKYL